MNTTSDENSEASRKPFYSSGSSEQQKFLKRSAEEHDPGGPGGGQSENFEPPVKLQCITQQHDTHQNEGLTKFSVEIVQQLEFTTSAASSQPQQISTNVTVKTHANASVKSDVSSPKSNPSTPHQKSSNIGLDVGTLVECKQEPDNDFADLDQCAEALEKDAAANGGTFGSFSDLIGDDTNDEIISSATFNDLISDINNYPDYELMKDFDFEDKSDIPKQEDVKDIAPKQNTHSPLLQNYSPPVFDKGRIPAYPNMDFSKNEMSPAAQTLKQMAEQHQHKNQMGLSFPPNARAPNARSPYPDFQFQGDFGSPNSNQNYHKNSPSFQQPEMIKQEMIFQGSDYDMKRKNAGMYNKQQYSPYSSPSASSHGSPGYLPRGGPPPPPPPNAGAGQFGGGTPPRPPSGSGGGGGNGPSVQINQAQQLNISQQSHGHTIQVSAGQHVHLTGDLKGNVSIAAQQGMHFSQHGGQTSSQSTQSSSANQQHSQPSPLSSAGSQHQHSPMGGMGGQGPMGGQGSMGGQGPMGGQGTMGGQGSMGGGMLSGNGQMGGQQGSMGGMHGSGGMGGPGNMSGADSLPSNMSGGGPGMGMPNNMGGMGGLNASMGGQGGMPSGMGGMPHGMGGGHTDSYSMSQTQTINFTQQTLRRAGGPGGMPTPMGPSGGQMGPGPMNAGPSAAAQSSMGPASRMLTVQQQQSLEQQQQKLLHQQQVLRAQQLQQQQQQAQQHMGPRPPPPDYKTSAGMMQGGGGPRYAVAPPGGMRRMAHQPMPPSGPMMRSSMFMLPQQQQQLQQQQQQQLQQQQMAPQRSAMYARQQGPMAGMEAAQHNSAEWRQLLMAQQQQQQQQHQGPGGMQMSAMQHQQLRAGGQQQQPGGGQLGQQAGQMGQAQAIQSQQQQPPSHAGQLLGPTNGQSSALASFNPQTDFNFEFLDNLGADAPAFTDQDLLNSFDSDAGFSLDF
ncbi:unnamed protein product [Phaedon cochleariae]|uniref:Neurogenic protein mastermind n=1 Tax=Phaedon cochleariae TaxID=80249 RepID=A0A9P0GSF6_PHACE|nr:unnamed protein product [Phaedon cochleariae]